MATTATRPGMETSILDKLGDAFNGVVEGSIGFVTRLFGTANDRTVRSLGYIRPKHADTHTVTPGSLLELMSAATQEEATA